jgi:N,N'-diacetyllegionaminate synthase
MTAQIASIPFGRRRIGPGEPVLVIAEIGINHEGSVETCARMIEEAVRAGADAVKLQTADPDENYAPGTESHKLFSQSQLSPEETARMFALARQHGLEAFTTTGGNTLPWVEKLDPPAYKISSGLLGHLPLIARFARTGRPLLISTGFGEADDIAQAVDTLKAAGGRDFGLFQCTSLYPAAPESLNLGVIRWLEQAFKAPAGFSDHSLGIEAAVLSVAAGARMIEKHFTLDKSRPGFDHGISLEPDEFGQMMKRIRVAETMLGDGMKQLIPEQVAMADRMRRYLVAARDIPAGDVLAAEDIAVMRLGEGRAGLTPKHYEQLIGKRAPCDIARQRPFDEAFLTSGK